MYKAQLLSDNYFPLVYSLHWVAMLLYILNMSRIGHALWLLALLLNMFLVIRIFLMRSTWSKLSISESISAIALVVVSILSFIYGNWKWELQISRIAWDGTWFVMILSGVFLAFMSQDGMKRFFWVNIVCAVLLLAVVFGKLDFELMLLGRDYTYSQQIESGMHWSLAWQLPQSLFLIFLLINQFFLRDRKLTVAFITLLLIYFFFNLVAGKRSMFVLLGATMLLITIYSVFRAFTSQYINKRITSTIIVTLIISISLMQIPQVSDLLYEVWYRFTSTANSFDRYDRLLETKDFFSQLNIIDWIFGKGIGVRAKFDSLLFQAPLHMHVGFADIIYHGGLLLGFTLLIPLACYLYNLVYVKELRARHQNYTVNGKLFRFFYIFFFLLGTTSYLSPISLLPSLLTGIYLFNVSIISNLVQFNHRQSLIIVKKLDMVDKKAG